MFSEFATRHQQGLHRFVFGLVRSIEDAEDIAQEAMMRAYRTRDRAGVVALDASQVPLESEARLGGWMYAIARNLSIDHLRRKRERAASDEELARTPSKDPPPEAVYERTLALESLRRSLGHLPRHYREILELRFMDALSYRQIAHRLGVPMTTVETRLHRSRRMLRRLLGQTLDV